jgi:transposase
MGVATLSLTGMARRKKGYRFGRSIGDNGYRQFVQILAHVLRELGLGGVRRRNAT